MATVRFIGQGRAVLLALLISSEWACAADCHLDSVVCKEGLMTDPYYVAGQTAVVPCKTLSGYSVCLSSIGRTCWGKHKSYTCIRPNAVNFCQPFESLQPQCWQTSTQCSINDTLFGSGCMTYAETWRCSDPALATPANTTRLDSTYTLVSSDYDTTPCATLNSTCSIASSTCTSTTAPALPAGVAAAQVAPDGCYERTNSYACLTGQSDNSECAGYSADPKCAPQGSSCTGDTIGGQCSMTTKTFRCETKPASSATVTDCSGQIFCAGGGCFNTSAPPDTDFARTMALMEAARQAGVYGTETEIFSGADSRCTKKLFGLANCCKKSGGGSGASNQMLVAAAKTGVQGLDVGSAYVYDSLYSGGTMQQGLGAMLGALGGDGLFNPSFNFYGFGFQFLPSQGFVFTGFDGVSLAIQVGVMILQDLLKCEQSEQITAMRRDQNLCQEIGTYCSNELKLLVAKICIEHTTSFCCFNSRLARIINQQARPQIGKGWGDGQSPNCRGFTMDEFASIDFSRVDLSEFTAEIMANVKMPNVSGMSMNISGAVQQKVQNYYNQGRQ